MNTFSNKEIILASNSPRRQQFLKDSGVNFTVQTHAVEEVFPPHLTASAIAEYLVKLKAAPFTNLTENQLLITADTIVWCDDQCLGKPTDRDQAFDMLGQLSGKMHEVITAVAFTQSQQQNIIHESTKVYFKPLSAAIINHYIDHYQPYDKAGAYGIQEWIGTVGIERIEGSYTNVVGLPVAQVLTTLKKIC